MSAESIATFDSKVRVVRSSCVRVSRTTRAGAFCAAWPGKYRNAISDSVGAPPVPLAAPEAPAPLPPVVALPLLGADAARLPARTADLPDAARPQSGDHQGREGHRTLQVRT